MMNTYSNHSLSKADVERYSRQLILSDFGVKGQEKLKTGKVLIVGAGGLGCPVASYLAAAGAGTIGIIDHDIVEVSNLHRQVLHTEDGVGTSKAVSICSAVKKLNSSVSCIPYNFVLTNSKAMELIVSYDVIVDCSDNAPTRYLLSDACVLRNKPLVSGSALRWEGQLTVYNYNSGPCYRCIFPNPPSPESVTNCSDSGVIGAVTGVIGSMQALEVLKILAGIGATYSGRLFVFDGFSGTTITANLRGRNPACVACGENRIHTISIDYEKFCGIKACDKEMTVTLLPPSDRITASQYATLRGCHSKNSVLIDVRPETEFDLAHLPGSINVPMHKLNDCALLKNVVVDKVDSCFVICRRGNDSQEAVLRLREQFTEKEIKDIIGGLCAWSYEVDNAFPIY